MESKQEAILRVLREDLQSFEDVHACGVIQKGLDGIFPITEEFKKEVLPVWEALRGIINEVFGVIEHYTEYGLNKIYFELGEFDVLFFILPRTDMALVVIVPALTNRELIEIKMENARHRIMKIIEDGAL